jgi:RNA polymerase-binding transcription factor DksA
LPGGGVPTVRPVTTTDVDGLVALYDGLSDDDRYRRFFFSFWPPRSFFEWLVDVGQRGGYGLVATAGLDGDVVSGARIVGEASYELLPNGDGELADDRWRALLGAHTALHPGVPVCVERRAGRRPPDQPRLAAPEGGSAVSVDEDQGSRMIVDLVDRLASRHRSAAGAPPAAPSTARRRLRDELDRLTSVRAVLAGEALDQETEAESVGELSSIDQHPADLGSETFERERELSLLEDVEAEIADVRRALVRLDRGGYGRCQACGRQIPDERLSAVPAARFCFEHQAAAEVIGRLET